MEITSQNFLETFPIVKASIESADFIAMDTEFSGYTVGLDDKGHEYDTLEERYQKLKFVCQKFVAFQVGLCTFKWDEERKKYMARPFCFFVFPRSQINDQVMLFQANAVSFLIGNNFNFNKVFSSSVSFQRMQNQKKVLQQCVYKVTKSFPSERQFSSLSSTHQSQLDTMMQKIEEFVFDPTSQNRLIFQIGSYSLKKALAKTVTKIYMNTGIFTEFQRALPETVIKKSKSFKQANFLRGFARPNDQTKGKVVVADLGFCAEDSMVDEKENSDNPTAMQVDDEEIKDEIPEILEPLNLTHQSSGLGFFNQENEDDPSKSLPAIERSQVKHLWIQEMGFSLVMQLVANSKKPLVGHNMIYDITFLMNQFFKELPETYNEFSTDVNHHFPKLYDTKVLSQEVGTMGKTELNHLYYKCCNDKKFSNNLQFAISDSDPKFLTYQSGGQSHDAGYDAYMTGTVFACLSKFIEIGQIIGQPVQSLATGNENQEKAASKTPGKKGKQEVAKKSQHYSSCQNKPTDFACLNGLVNKIMLDVDIPRYFHFQRTLTEVETIDLQRKKQNSLQIEIEGSDVVTVAKMFTLFGDVQVVKQSPHTYWVDFEGYSNPENESSGIESIMKAVQKSHPNVKIRVFDDAVRFKV